MKIKVYKLLFEENFNFQKVRIWSRKSLINNIIFVVTKNKELSKNYPNSKRKNKTKWE